MSVRGKEQVVQKEPSLLVTSHTDTEGEVREVGSVGIGKCGKLASWQIGGGENGVRLISHIIIHILFHFFLQFLRICLSSRWAVASSSSFCSSSLRFLTPFRRHLRLRLLLCFRLPPSVLRFFHVPLFLHSYVLVKFLLR